MSKKLMDDDDDGHYYNSGGLVVFNEEYLLRRGYCCGNGCKHCPFEYKMVPEPRRTKLLEDRKNNPDQQAS